MKITPKTVLPNGWTKDSIQSLLATSDRAVERALVQIYHRQTLDEKKAGDTSEHNGVGFTGIDGEFLSDVAAKCIKYNGLTAGQLKAVRPKMMKYWKQLMEIAEQSPVSRETSKAMQSVAYREASKGK
jgi:hypothetical protein